MNVIVNTASLYGVKSQPVTVEVDLLRRLPAVVVVGLPASTVRETADRVRSAVEYTGFEFPKRRVVVALNPADAPRRGTHYDLAVAVGILAASDQMQHASDTAYFGELSLSGELRAVRGLLPMLIGLPASVRKVVVPSVSNNEAAMAAKVRPDLEIRTARSLEEVINGQPKPAVEPEPAPKTGGVSIADLESCSLQLPDLRRAFGAAAVRVMTSRNVLLVGRSGSGKTMLAARLNLTRAELKPFERVEIASAMSAAGLMNAGIGRLDEIQRPFRAPHHSISAAGMIGSSHNLIGEASLANHGILFLDELPMFGQSVIEVLGACISNGEVVLRHSGATGRVPCRPIIVAACSEMNERTEQFMKTLCIETIVEVP